MTDKEHISKLLPFLTAKEWEEINIKVEDGNVVYSSGNDSVGIPLPDWQPVTIEE